MKRRSLALLLILTLMGCNRAPDTGKLGQRLEYKGFAMTVTAVEFGDDFDGARKARAGYTLATVEILVENPGGRAGAHWDPEHARLIERSNGDANQHRTQGRTPVLGARLDIPQGELLRGWLTFEVPDRARALTFVYETPRAFDNVKLSVDLDKK